MHLHALNRGILLTPFHNMSLMSPATTAEDVDRHTEVFREGVGELVAGLSRRRARDSAGQRSRPALFQLDPLLDHLVVRRALEGPLHGVVGAGDEAVQRQGDVPDQRLGAERVGFEPTRQYKPAHSLSKRAP